MTGINVLFVCLDNYPNIGACANIVRNICVSGELNNRVKINVLTVRNSYSSSDEEYIDGVSVRRLYIPEYIFSGDFRKRINKNFFFDIIFYLRKIKTKLLEKFVRSKIFLLSNSTCKKIIEMPWLASADVIIPVLGHFDATKLSLELKKKYQKKLIVLQVDPNTNNGGYSKESEPTRLHFENAMILQADVIFVLPEQYKDLQQRLTDSELKNKIKLFHVPNVTSVFLRTFSEISLDKNSCVFTGALHSKIRDPEYMLRLFVNAPISRLYLVGKYKSDIMSKIPNGIICLGRKSLDETKTILNSADFLVNLGNAVPNQVPSKIFDYISFRKPIIHIRKLENDPSMVYLSKYPLCLDLYEGDPIEMNLQKLEAFIKENKGKTVPAEYIAETYRECTPEYVANQLYEAILEVTGKAEKAEETAETENTGVSSNGVNREQIERSNYRD